MEHSGQATLSASIILGILLGAALLTLSWLAFANRRQRLRLTRSAHLEQLVKRIQPEAGLANNLSLFLEAISQMIEVDSYTFYIREEAGSETFVLKAVRYRREGPGQIGPSYSGLAPYEKERYQPPLAIPADALARTTGLVSEGAVPLYNMPVGTRGLVRIGPVRSISRRQSFLLGSVGADLPHLLDVLAESDRMDRKASIVETSRAALEAISTMAMDPEAVVRKALGMSASALGLTGGCLFVVEAGAVSMPMFFGWSDAVKRSLSDMANTSLLLQLIESYELTLWGKDDVEFEQAVSLLGGISEGFLLAGRLPMPGKRAYFVGGLHRHAMNEQSEAQLRTTFKTMTRQLAQLLAIQERMKPFAHTYAEFLKLLAGTIDDLNPFTVGYSELMSRYSIIIAKRLGLADDHVRDIGTAAYLSNIGVLGLSEELYLKEGRYTELEFETMKLHSEVGAVIAEMTLGSKRVADMIRYHHERIDGQGYPAGLRGDRIPVGSRILFVVQTFLAKINGRKYREPMPFQEAIRSLETLAGSQLDADIVQAFVGWFAEKRGGPQLGGRALGACWDMLCSPSDVCRQCPAYQRDDKDCFVIAREEGVNCKSHGKVCETCFVYTETATRS
ncbi:HD-GYP domain-containing protein [Paenibacillus aurantiacus]|uniref:HD-GYP domain-containing protein n=1 Tax=Paenibacillus aurantiacus TaxID=1936118 RepID=A0ABV5KJ05_9BACL